MERVDEHFDSLIPVPGATQSLKLDWKLSFNSPSDAIEVEKVERVADDGNTNQNNEPVIRSSIEVDNSKYLPQNPVIRP